MSASGGTFDSRKRDILDNISKNIDYSPKGSIDKPILHLIDVINAHHDLVTTSSCSGRISVFAGIRSDVHAKGIRWLLVRHGIICLSDVLQAIYDFSVSNANSVSSNNLLSIKCEPMILHIEARNVETARSVHKLAMDAGYRESGITLGQRRVMIAIRTTSNSMEVPIQYQSTRLLADHALEFVVHEMNNRLLNNFHRIQKLCSIMKSEWQWPGLRLQSLPRSNPQSTTSTHSLQRWGHAAAAVGGDIITIGGYGLPTDSHEDPLSSASSSQQARRKLPLLVVNSSTMTSTMPLRQIEEINTSMHSACCKLTTADGDSYLVVSGGRTSPNDPLPCLHCIVDIKVQVSLPVTVEAQTSSPEARWGHTLTLLQEKDGIFTLLLFSGRNDSHIFADAFVLEIAIAIQRQDANATHTPNNSHACGRWRQLNFAPESPLPALFFHAACVIQVCNSNEQIEPIVVVHGGLRSLAAGMDVDSCSAAMFAINPWTAHCAPISHKEIAPQLCRFGHTLTNLGANTLLLIGGCNFTGRQSSSIEEIDAEDSASRVHKDDAHATSEISGELLMDRQGMLLVDVFVFYHTNQATEFTYMLRPAISSLTGDKDIDVPCRDCRCHHTTLFDPDTRQITVLGGGMLCLGFGAHFCQSLQLTIDGDTSANLRGDESTSKSSVTTSTTEGLTESVNNPPVTLNNSSSQQSSPVIVLLVSKERVKSVKLYLEQNSWNDKTRRITEVTEDFSELTRIQLDDTNSDGDATWNRAGAMAVPINEALTKILLPAVSSTSSERDRFSTAALDAVKQSLRAIVSSPVLIVGQQATVRVSRTILANSYAQADAYLQQLCAGREFTPADRKNLPAKYEVVGDAGIRVVMIPEGALQGGQWDRLLTPNDAPRVQQIWKALLQFFPGADRVARKARVDSGPKRESRVYLLYPNATGVASATNGGIDPTETEVLMASSPIKEEGWVTVTENAIVYGFDITRVMFCSGNVTERMRMGRENCKGQVVVDLYCGVGYYTLPFLVHGQAAFLHACEWNPNSVRALKENLRRMKVDTSRYMIHFGDNRVTTAAANLVDLADRVCLGLLPSSEGGWEIACKALKRSTGGILHVHENVREDTINDWVEYMLEKLRGYFALMDKAMVLECRHIEKVKSYAPRVLHVVADVHCTPVELLPSSD